MDGLRGADGLVGAPGPKGERGRDLPVVFTKFYQPFCSFPRF